MKASKTIRIGTIAGLGLLLGGRLLAAQPSEATRGLLSESDYKFVIDAARGGMEEVQLGQLAEQKGANQAVRSFGQRMVTDHTKANDELRQIAMTKGATLPTQFTSSERSTIEDLQKTSGTDFDKDYAKQMVKDHKTDVKEFEKAAKNLKDPDLRAYAERTLPILQEHLQMAKHTEEIVKNER